MGNFSDAEIHELFDSGQVALAYDHLVRQYSQRLYWHIRKMLLVHEDANDVLQNTLLKAWTGFPQFRWESQLFTWLYRIATNEVLSFLKRNHTPDAAAADTLEDGNNNYFNGDSIQAALQKAIQKLPNKQRLVFNMRYFDEIKYEDMSAILGTSVGALKASYHHAAQKVEESLKEMLL